MDGTMRAEAAAQWLRLVEAMAFCGRQLRRTLGEVAAPAGLSDTECLILWACCEAPPEGQGQHELVTLLGVSPAQLSGLVERLSSQGWIVARRPAHDRRRQYWKLTPQGQALVTELLNDVSRWLAGAPQVLTLAEQQLLESRLVALGGSLAATTSRAKEAA